MIVAADPAAVLSQPAYRIANATVPEVCLGAVPAGAATSIDGLVEVDLIVERGRIAAIDAPKRAPNGLPVHDADGGMAWPCFVDLHTHLDKGHIWPRSRNPDGTFWGAKTTVKLDRETHWTPDDMLRRMEFSLRCAYAHGTKAVRTHIDSYPPQHKITWPIIAGVRDAWAGRIDLQFVSLAPLPLFADMDVGREMADLVARRGGILGAVCYIEDDIETLLDNFLTVAGERGLDVDLHVDEGLDPEASSLRAIAEAVIRNDFRGKVNCGHCCSLSAQTDEYVELVLSRVADSGLSVVSLPMCNMYLQDRIAGRTPRRRGVTLVQELRANNVPVSIASDNTRDPFYGFGDLDMLEVFTQATRIAHLDSDYGPWPAAITTTPASIMGKDDCGRIAIGGSADLVLLRGRDYSETLSRVRDTRIVLRAGRPIDAVPPDYRELDDLFVGSNL